MTEPEHLAAVSTEPVAWHYSCKRHIEVFQQPNRANMDLRYWAETPLYPHPPTVEREAIVEVTKAQSETLHKALIASFDSFEAPASTPALAEALAERDARIAQLESALAGFRLPGALYTIGQRLTKRSGASWTGLVVGFYSTTFTPIGYCIESETETSSVQLYPEKALQPK